MPHELEPQVSMDYNQPDEGRSQYLDRVRAAGFEIVVPEYNQVQIDIDGPDQWERHRQLLSMLSDKGSWINIDKVDTQPSRSGEPGKYHITITFDRPVEHWERIAWQACLGSDVKRELFSCIRTRYNEPVPVCFFEKKVQNGTTN